MSYKCAICRAETTMGYTLCSIPEDYTLHFCSRVHLIEFVAPELKNVCVPRQWLKEDIEEVWQQDKKM